MHILLAILGYVLLVILIILGLIIVLLFIPVRLFLEYKASEFNIKVAIVFFKFKIYPLPKKQKKRVKNEKETQDENIKAPAKKKKQGLSFYAEDIIEIIITASGFIKNIMHSMLFSKICLTLPVFKNNVALTAIEYGKMNSYIGGVYATLKNILRINVDDISIICDYDNIYKDKTYFYCKVSAIPIIIIIVAIYAIVKLKQKQVF